MKRSPFKHIRHVNHCVMMNKELLFKNLHNLANPSSCRVDSLTRHYAKDIFDGLDEEHLIEDYEKVDIDEKKGDYNELQPWLDTINNMSFDEFDAFLEEGGEALLKEENPEHPMLVQEMDDEIEEIIASKEDATSNEFMDFLNKTSTTTMDNEKPDKSKKDEPFIDDLKKAAREYNKNMGKIGKVMGIKSEDMKDDMEIRELFATVYDPSHIKQSQLEDQTLDITRKKFKEHIDSVKQRGAMGQVGASLDLISAWYDSIIQQIKRYQRLSVSDPDALPSTTYREFMPYISLLDPEKIVILSVQELINRMFQGKDMETPYVKLAFIQNKIGSLLKAQYEYDILSKIHKPSKSRIARARSKPTFHYLSTIHYEASKQMSENQELDEVLFQQIGAIMVDILLKHAEVPVNPDNKYSELVPAFEHVKKQLGKQSYKQVGVLTPSEALVNYMETRHQSMQVSQSFIRHLPMVLKPKDWSQVYDGAYHSIDSYVMRTKQSLIQKHVLREAVLDELFEGLNVLNSTAWRINPNVHATILKIWELGGGKVGMPSREDMPIPQTIPKNDPYAEKPGRLKTLQSRARRYNTNLHSLRCDIELKLDVAKQFCDEPNIYLPHNIDFRGRAYPIPPHLNQMGADFSRALFMFAKGKPLGERGLWWLTIHLANVCGFDKASFHERIDWVHARKKEIMASAEDPLTFTWWQEQENPLLCLAAAFELSEAWRLDDPSTFISHIPVQMDGSCNGLQHYAALGRDVMGGLHVNLIPSEKPMDVYAGVMDVVKRFVDQDAASGLSQAIAVQGHIKRKTIKQTVMTTVYGVTLIGAKDQIRRQLKDAGEVDEEVVDACALYLSKTVFRSLGEVFGSARAIMDWLNTCAQLISKHGRPVVWITPLGLPAVQPYRSLRKRNIKTIIQNITVVSSGDSEPIDTSRQTTAFPPNYVHSLDATHMLMTARACSKIGLDFSAVHDSFWTSACDVDQMNSIIRDKFVELYNQPLLETLLDSFRTMYPSINFPEIPPRGTLDLNRVKQSPFFFH